MLVEIFCKHLNVMKMKSFLFLNDFNERNSSKSTKFGEITFNWRVRDLLHVNRFCVAFNINKSCLLKLNIRHFLLQLRFFSSIQGVTILLTHSNILYCFKNPDFNFSSDIKCVGIIKIMRIRLVKPTIAEDTFKIAMSLRYVIQNFLL